MKHIIANLKEHQNLTDANTWINSFVNIMRAESTIREKIVRGHMRVIVAPSAPFLLLFKTAVHEFSGISIAAQDVSIATRGSYTGEIGSHMLAGIVDYVIVGHSERRSHFGETNHHVQQKIDSLTGSNILPIVCVRSQEDIIELNRGMVAYEPADAIGSGRNYPVETVTEFGQRLNLPAHVSFLYGGSVDETNQMLYLKSPQINGLLIGSASLDAARFCKLLAGV